MENLARLAPDLKIDNITKLVRLPAQDPLVCQYSSGNTKGESVTFQWQVYIHDSSNVEVLAGRDSDSIVNKLSLVEVSTLFEVSY